MKTHVWIKAAGEMQYTPIATLVLTIKTPTSGDQIYLANGIRVTNDRWEELKETIGVYAANLDAMTRNY